MSQKQQTASAQPQPQPQPQQAQNFNQISITFIRCDDGTICIVSIVSPDGQKIFGNGIGTIVPMNRITKKGDSITPVENQKQYTFILENEKWNVILDGNLVHTFDEIFGLPDGFSPLKNVSFCQFKYVPTAVDERTETFRKLLGQLVSTYPDRFCFEDHKKQKTAHVGGLKVRITEPIFDLVKQLQIDSGVSPCSFVKHFMNGSKNGVSRGDMDFYVCNDIQAKLVIKILTKLGFVKDSSNKSNGETYRLYVDELCDHFCQEAIMQNFNLPKDSDPTQYYIEVEIIIATEFQKEYKSNCLGYFLGLLLSRLFKISTSGVSLKHGCDEIPINVGSFDEFLKKLGINLDGIQTTSDFIEQLLVSPLISELMTVDDILRLFKNIMGDEKTKHTSKPLREWLHLLVCGLKKRFPDRFSSLRSELIQEIIQDDNGQMIPIWSVRLFVLNTDSVFHQVQMEKGILSIDCGKKQFVSTGVDGNSLIFSEKQVKSDSGKKALPDIVKQYSKLFELLKDYFDYLKGINFTKSQVELFIDALKCRSEVCSHLGIMGQKLIRDIIDELKKPLFPISRNKSSKIDGKNYGELMKNLKYNDSFVQMLEQFLLSNGFVGTINSFVIEEVNSFFKEYTEELMRLSKEADELDLSLKEQNQKRGRLYDCFISSVKTIAMNLVQSYKEFYNSDVNWTVDSSTGKALHILTNTVHELTDSVLPYYLGTSVFGEKPVSVFMDGQSGEVFTMAIE